jgi:hypothetical protein
MEHSEAARTHGDLQTVPLSSQSRGRLHADEGTVMQWANPPAGRKSMSGDRESSIDDQVVTLNPIVGLNLDDLARVGARVAQSALLQPMIAAEHVLKLNTELVKVLFGTSERKLPAGDRRFGAEAYHTNPLYARLALSWLGGAGQNFPHSLSPP